MFILGINAYHPDSSAAIIRDGELIAACEEERFRRIKHFAGFPLESVKYCLREARISAKDLDYIAIPRSPRARIIRKIFYGVKMPALAKRRLFALARTIGVKEELSELFNIDQMEIGAKIIRVEHHRAHLASSFFVSDFDRAFLFSADALGDFGSCAWGIGEGNMVRISGEVAFPHSLGFYYTAITQYLGFLHFGDEYKVMGLAPYGESAFEDEFKKILKIRKNKFGLDTRYFLHTKKYIDMNFENGYPETDILFSPYLEKRLGKRRRADEPIEKRHKDTAFALQKRLEEVILHLLNSLSFKNIGNLCLSGGVSHNSAANGKLFGGTHFKKIYIPPAPGDAGLAIGAAFYLWNQMLRKPRIFKMTHAYWGPAYRESEIEKEIESKKSRLIGEGCAIGKIDDENALCDKIALEISKGKIVGWFQGRTEWGPRALGNRSILADPRREGIKDVLNKRVKHRESFRPFAPSVAEEDAGDYFKEAPESPFMSFVCGIKENRKNSLLAVSHIDGTARPQTVNKDANFLYWKLIKKFKDITGVPALLNTSFNENEPIVNSPEEAIDCFLRTQMDILSLGPFIISKNKP